MVERRPGFGPADMRGGGIESIRDHEERASHARCELEGLGANRHFIRMPFFGANAFIHAPRQTMGVTDDGRALLIVISAVELHPLTLAITLRLQIANHAP